MTRRKIVASKKLNTYINKIKIHRDVVFLIDNHVNLKIFDYKIPDMKSFGWAFFGNVSANILHSQCDFE